MSLDRIPPRESIPADVNEAIKAKEITREKRAELKEMAKDIAANATAGQILEAFKSRITHVDEVNPAMQRRLKAEDLHVLASELTPEQHKEAKLYRAKEKGKKLYIQDTYDVMLVQGLLRKLAMTDKGNNPVTVDGVWGEKTKEALAQFQESKGIKADGEFGPETLAALEKHVNDIEPDYIIDKEKDVVEGRSKKAKKETLEGLDEAVNALYKEVEKVAREILEREGDPRFTKKDRETAARLLKKAESFGKFPVTDQDKVEALRFLEQMREKIKQDTETLGATVGKKFEKVLQDNIRDGIELVTDRRFLVGRDAQNFVPKSNELVYSLKIPNSKVTVGVPLLYKETGKRVFSEQPVDTFYFTVDAATAAKGEVTDALVNHIVYIQNYALHKHPDGKLPANVYVKPPTKFRPVEKPEAKVADLPGTRTSTPAAPKDVVEGTRRGARRRSPGLDPEDIITHPGKPSDGRDETPDIPRHHSR